MDPLAATASSMGGYERHPGREKARASPARSFRRGGVMRSPIRQLSTMREGCTIRAIRLAIRHGQLQEPFRASAVDKALGIKHAGVFLTQTLRSASG